MARYDCVRCGQESNTLSEPHLCRDVAARLKEAERGIAIMDKRAGTLDGYLARMDAMDSFGAAGPRVAENIDLIMLHSGQLVDPRHVPAEDFDALRRLRERGGIRYGPGSPAYNERGKVP